MNMDSHMDRPTLSNFKHLHSGLSVFAQPASDNTMDIKLDDC